MDDSEATSASCFARAVWNGSRSTARKPTMPAQARPSTATRKQSFGEELANSITHGAALLASIVVFPVLVIVAANQDDAWQVVGSTIFGASMIMLYLASTLYHALPQPRVKQALRVLDHASIYLLIAGTYTPFTLGVLRGPWGWALFGTIWALALIGVAAKCTVGFRYPRLSTLLYVSMGWLALVAIHPLAVQLSSAGLLWLLGGGVCYTGGVYFFVTDARVRYGHAIWHVFVVAGTTCHFFAVLGHAG